MKHDWREVVAATDGQIEPKDSNTLMAYKDDGTFALVSRTGFGQPYVDFVYVYSEMKNFGNSLGDMLLYLANNNLHQLSEPGMPAWSQGNW